MKKDPPRLVKFRHRVILVFLKIAVPILVHIRYRTVSITKFREKKKRPYFILYNHQTAYDQFLVSLTFREPVYHVASDDLFANGFVSKLIDFLVAPIPIKKQATDIAAIKQCLRVAREGGSIAMAPEGNRTFSGRTEYMSATVAPLAKRMKLPILLLRIEGGYGVHPRFSDVARRGKMRTYVARVLEPEEYADMSDEALFALIKETLYVDETKNTEPYVHKKSAEYLERVMYVCPDCGLSRFESHGNAITCKTCGKRIFYKENKQLTGDGFDFPFAYVLNWYDYQNDFVSSLDLTAQPSSPYYEDFATMSRVLVRQKRIRLQKNAPLSLYGDRIEAGSGQSRMVFSFDRLYAASVLGRNKLNLYHEDGLFQFKGDKRFNAVKYVNFYYRYKNMNKETANGKFLGL